MPDKNVISFISFVFLRYPCSWNFIRIALVWKSLLHRKEYSIWINTWQFEYKYSLQLCKSKHDIFSIHTYLEKNPLLVAPSQLKSFAEALKPYNCSEICFTCRKTGKAKIAISFSLIWALMNWFCHWRVYRETCWNFKGLRLCSLFQLLRILYQVLLSLGSWFAYQRSVLLILAASACSSTNLLPIQ